MPSNGRWNLIRRLKVNVGRWSEQKYGGPDINFEGGTQCDSVLSMEQYKPSILSEGGGGNLLQGKCNNLA